MAGQLQMSGGGLSPLSPPDVRRTSLRGNNALGIGSLGLAPSARMAVLPSLDNSPGSSRMPSRPHTSNRTKKSLDLESLPIGKGGALPPVLPKLTDKKKKKKKMKKKKSGGEDNESSTDNNTSIDSSMDTSIDFSMDSSTDGFGSSDLSRSLDGQGMLDLLDSPIRHRRNVNSPMATGPSHNAQQTNMPISPPPQRVDPRPVSPPREHPPSLPSPETPTRQATVVNPLSFMHVDDDDGPDTKRGNAVMGDFMTGSSAFRMQRRGTTSHVPSKPSVPKKSSRAVAGAEFLHRDRSHRAPRTKRSGDGGGEKEPVPRSKVVYNQLKRMGYTRIKQIYYKDGWMFFACKSEKKIGLSSCLCCSKCTEELYITSKEDRHDLYRHVMTHKRLKVRCVCGHKCHMGPEMKAHAASCEVHIQRILKKHTKQIAQAIKIAQKMADNM